MTYLEKCPAMSASGVMWRRCYVRCGLKLSLLPFNTATRLVEATSFRMGFRDAGGATVSRVLACLIRIQARLLNKFPGVAGDCSS